MLIHFQGRCVMMYGSKIDNSRLPMNFLLQSFPSCSLHNSIPAPRSRTSVSRRRARRRRIVIRTSTRTIRVLVHALLLRLSSTVVPVGGTEGGAGVLVLHGI